MNQNRSLFKIFVYCSLLLSMFFALTSFSKESKIPSPQITSSYAEQLSSLSHQKSIKAIQDEAAAAREKSANENALVKYTLWLAISTFLLCIFTALLWFVTYRLSKDAKSSSDKQFFAMQQSILEANRSAMAMENVAEATNNNARLMTGILHQQMRAYLAVEVGTATYQDANNRFAGAPILINTGFTPARNVNFSINASILTVRDTGSGNIRIPENGPMIVNDAGLAPRQQFIINGVVDNRLSDEDVKEVLGGVNKRLYVWGEVTYDDVFDGHWVTNFCHYYTFFQGKDGQINHTSWYHQSRNEAT